MLVLILIIYTILSSSLVQFYKLTTRTMKNASAQTVGLELLAGLSCLLFLPFFEFKLPSNPWTYLFLALSCVFYALNNRMMANVRKNVEASTIGILGQSYTVLMTLAGFVLLNEQITLFKIIGISLIIAGNILVFWRRKNSKGDKAKYVWIGILAYVCNVIAGLIDVGYSGEFNLPFYSAILYFLPALFIFIGSRIRVKDVVKEFKRANKCNYFITGFCWGVHYLVLLIAYSMYDVSIVAPLSSLVVFVNVIVGYFWLKEKDRMPRKIAASLLAILGVVLISIA